jgi:Diacylglycerol acyltransferase
MKSLTVDANGIRQHLHHIMLFLNMCLLIPMWTIGICLSLYMSLFYVALYYDESYILLTILMLYLLYIVYDRNDGPAGRRFFGCKHDNKNHLTRNWLCFKYVAAYFPIKLHKTVDITNTLNESGKQSKAFLFLYQPHGVIGMGANTAINTNGCNFDELFPKLGVHYGVTLDVPFYVPFLRDFMISLGFVNARKSTLEHILRDRRESIVLVPGGAMEALYTQQNTLRCLLKTAPIRLALSTNATIVPCIGFGENDAFRVHAFPLDSISFRIQKFMCQTLSFSTPVLLSPFAQRCPINVVIGEPIDFASTGIVDPTNISQITDDIIMTCQSQYTSAVEKLYDKHKARFGYTNIPLQWIRK